MADSTRTAQSSQTSQAQLQTPQPHQRLCDFCGQSKALLYCRADSAKLCFSCDHEVHSTNPLFFKHSRSQLCDRCDSKPASIYCSTENLVLCQNCDWDSHGGGGGTGSSCAHDRRPVEGFTGCPCLNELCSIFGFQDLGDKFSSNSSKDGCLESGIDVDWLSDLLVWDSSSIASLDDLIFSNDSRQDFQAVGVPSLPKNRDSSCGKYKDAILSQLRNMSKSEARMTTDHREVGSLLGLQPLVLDSNHQPGLMGTGLEHDAEPIVTPTYEESGSKWKGNSSDSGVMIPVPSFSTSFTEENSVLNKTNDVGSSGRQTSNGDHEYQSQSPITRETRPFLSRFAPNELITHNRDSSILRYKEKKKNRRYDKHIRYETRKARAEGRTRIKGRFAKVVDH